MPRRRQETIKFLTFDELKRLFNTIKAEGNKRDRALFLLGYRYGLRASEVGRLYKADVDFKTQNLLPPAEGQLLGAAHDGAGRGEDAESLP